MIRYNTLRYVSIHFDTLGYVTIQFNTLRYSLIHLGGMPCGTFASFLREIGSGGMIKPCDRAERGSVHTISISEYVVGNYLCIYLQTEDKYNLVERILL